MLQDVVIHIVHDHVFATDRAGRQSNRIEIQGAAIGVGVGRAVAFGDGSLGERLDRPIVACGHPKNIHGGHRLEMRIGAVPLHVGALVRGKQRPVRRHTGQRLAGVGAVFQGAVFIRPFGVQDRLILFDGNPYRTDALALFLGIERHHVKHIGHGADQPQEKTNGDKFLIHHSDILVRNHLHREPTEQGGSALRLPLYKVGAYGDIGFSVSPKSLSAITTYSPLIVLGAKIIRWMSELLP